MTGKPLAFSMALVPAMCGASCASSVGDGDQVDGAVQIVGAAQKGPFLLGSTVRVVPLDVSGAPTGAVFISQTGSDRGDFVVSVNHVGPVALEADGFFYNELSGSLSAAQLSLRAVADGESVFVNVFTHLTHDRIRSLMQTGIDVAAAVAQADSELAGALDVGPVGSLGGSTGAELDMLGGDTDPNAYLLAVSSVLTRVAENRGGFLEPILQELLNRLSADLASSGDLSSPMKSEIAQAEREIDTVAIKAAFADRLLFLGVTTPVPDIDRIIDTDDDGVVNASDNCPANANATQDDRDTDGIGDVCDCGGDTLNPENGEVCDDGDNNGLYGYCSADCSIVTGCGNGALEAADEFCDDGNTESADMCSADCQTGWWLVAKLACEEDPLVRGYGARVALSGDTMLLSGYLDNEAGNVAGAAYVLERDAGGADRWGQVAKLQPSDAGPGLYFGESIALDGDVAVVGTYHHAANGDASGAVYVFERNTGGNGAWGQTAQLFPSDPAPYQNFGLAVAVDGDRIVIGARGDATKGPYSGAAYVFKRGGPGLDEWLEVAKLLPSIGATWDDFGWSVDVSGSTVVVGAPGESTGYTEVGAAFVFEEDRGGAGAWGEAARLAPVDPADDQRFGRAVAISGSTAVAGADGDSTNGANSGATYIFERDFGGAGTWGQSAKLTPSDGAATALFGRAVDIDGSFLVVAAPQDRLQVASSGAVYVYEYSAGIWTRTWKLTSPADAAYTYVGETVSCSTPRVAAGTSNSEVAVVFEPF